MPVLADLVQFFTNGGSGNLTVTGAASPFMTPAQYGAPFNSGATVVYYSIVDPANGASETGVGSYAASGTVLTRTTVITSTNSNAAINASTTAYVSFTAIASAILSPSGSVTAGHLATWGTQTNTLVDGGAVPTGAVEWIWGDGSDGNVTVSSGTTTLSRDMYYNNLTINGTGQIVTNGYRIYVAGILDISAAPAGAIQWNGNAAVGTSGGLPLSNANLGGSPSGAGAAYGAIGNNGTIGANGGSTLAAGADGSNTSVGGLGATNTFLGTQFPNTKFGLVISGPDEALAIGGASGPSGGSVSSGYSGAGGSGAGVLVIVARIIARGTNTTAGIIQAKGGNGSAGSNVTLAPASGGGSGAGGGWIILAFGQLTGSTIVGAIDLSGGAGESGGNTNSIYKGGYGGASGCSGVLHLYNFSTQLLTVTNSVSGSLGAAPSGITGGAGAPQNTKQINL
jgi:hypothetical protein